MVVRYDKILNIFLISFLLLSLSLSSTSFNLGSDLNYEQIQASAGVNHYSDSKGGYGLVANNGSSPVINGNVGMGEWDDANHHLITEGGQDIASIYVKYNSGNLYVCTQLYADTNGPNQTDYCELVFDSDHDGSSLEPSDKRIKLYFNGNNETYEGQSGSWSSITYPGTWMGASGSAGTGIVYEFSIDLGMITTSPLVDGYMIGSCVHIYSNDIGMVGNPDAYLYWPDRWDFDSGEYPTPDPINDPTLWGDLFYRRSRLVINEVSSFGSGNDEWVELYNAGSNISLNGINITDQDGNFYQFNTLKFPHDCYLVLKSGLGIDDTDFSDGRGTMYLGGKVSWSADTFMNGYDDVLLKYGGNDCGIDYMNYTDGTGYGDPCPLDNKSSNSWSIAGGGWLSNPTMADHSLMRIPNGVDTNDSQDWTLADFNTEGHENKLNFYQPDMLIDGDIDGGYQDTPQGDQDKSKEIYAGKNASWGIDLQNDGSENDTFHLTADTDMMTDWGWNLTRNDTNQVVLNKTVKSTNISLNKGNSMNYTLRIFSSPLAVGGDSSWVILNATSQNNSVKKDAVKATAEIKTYDKPEIRNVTDSPDPQYPGGYVNISCNVTDDLSVYGVWVNITSPDGTTLGNYSMNYSIITSNAYFNRTYSVSGTYDYTIWANDTSYKWNSSTGHNFTIQEEGDTNPPEIRNVTDSPDPQEQDEYVNISCDVSDDADVDRVSVNITRPDDSWENVSMKKGSGYGWYHNDTYSQIGTHTYTIWANDTSNNWNSSSGHDFTIQDTEEPSMDVEKEVDGETADPGDIIVYTIYYNNTGTEKAGHVWINDTFDDNLLYVDDTCDVDPSISGDTYSWHLENVSTGTHSFDISCEVSKGTLDDTVIGNYASLDYTDEEGESMPGDTSNTVRTEVTAPVMSLGKEVDKTFVKAGDSLTYTITYDNEGDGTAGRVWINDTLTSELSYIDDTCRVTPSVTSAPSGTKYSWYLTDIEPGEYNFQINLEIDSDVGNGTEIENRAYINYTDENDNLIGGNESEIVKTTVKEELENKPPVISGVPDLVVHFDHDYPFDLSPYIGDEDNTSDELSLSFSDGAHVEVNRTNHLGMILNYPRSLNGSTIPLTIWVSDGIGSDSQTINVEVTHYYPPEKIKPLPDVTFDEDSIHYGFNIPHHFRDRDSTLDYLTSGEEHITVAFLDNGTTRFSAEEHWNGYEFITIKASDPTGGIVEDTILVTVEPVNDAPTIEEIPKQRVKVEEAQTLNLTPYLDDIDDNVSSLRVTVKNDNVKVVGQTLIFNYPKGFSKDTDEVEITVSDGELEGSEQVEVRVVKPTFWEKIYWPWSLIPFLIPIPAAAYYLYMRTVIDEAFLIYENGILIAHETRRLKPGMDDDIFSSMLTAIQDFVKDSFKDEKEWGLKKLEFGDKKILVKKGKKVYMAVLYSGRATGYVENKMESALKKIEKEYEEILQDWDGDMESVRGIKDHVKEIF